MRTRFVARMQPKSRPQTNTCNQRHLDKNKYKQIAATFFCSPLSLSFCFFSSSSSAASTSCTFLHKIPTILAANAKGPGTATATWECPPKKRETDKNPRKETGRGERERPRSGHFIYCYFISTAN